MTSGGAQTVSHGGLAEIDICKENPDNILQRWWGVVLQLHSRKEGTAQGGGGSRGSKRSLPARAETWLLTLSKTLNCCHQEKGFGASKAGSADYTPSTS